MPSVMAALPNIGGALRESYVIPFLVPCRKVWLMPAAAVPYSNAANIGERKTSTQSEFCTGQNSVRGTKAIFGNFLVLYFQREPRAAHFRPAF